jgi:hypothetical protein
MTPRAKFKVTEITQREFGKSLILQPVYSSDPNSENGKFYKQTPGGKIEIMTINESVSEQFIIGKELYIDFTPCE